MSFSEGKALSSPRALPISPVCTLALRLCVSSKHRDAEDFVVQVRRCDKGEVWVLEGRVERAVFKNVCLTQKRTCRQTGRQEDRRG